MERSKYFKPNRGRDERKVSPNERRTFEVSTMWELHHEIVRRILLGQKNVDIAKALSISEVTVSYTRNSQVVKDKLEIMKGARDAETIDLSKRIREGAPKALKLLEDAIDGEVVGADGEPREVTTMARLREANTMLDRAGYAAIRTFRGEHLVAHFTGEEIEKIKERARGVGIDSGVVVEAEITRDSE